MNPGIPADLEFPSRVISVELLFRPQCIRFRKPRTNLCLIDYGHSECNTRNDNTDADCRF